MLIKFSRWKWRQRERITVVLTHFPIASLSRYLSIYYTSHTVSKPYILPCTLILYPSDIKQNVLCIIYNNSDNSNNMLLHVIQMALISLLCRVVCRLACLHIQLSQAKGNGMKVVLWLDFCCEHNHALNSKSFENVLILVYSSSKNYQRDFVRLVIQLYTMQFPGIALGIQVEKHSKVLCLRGIKLSTCRFSANCFRW